MAEKSIKTTDSKALIAKFSLLPAHFSQKMDVDLCITMMDLFQAIRRVDTD